MSAKEQKDYQADTAAREVEGNKVSGCFAFWIEDEGESLILLGVSQRLDFVFKF